MSNAVESLWQKNGTTQNIVEAILEMDKKADQWVDANSVDCLRGKTDYETLKNVWAFVKKNVNYKADRKGAEKVKSPGALFQVGQGDCKSFSIAEAAILRALGIEGIRYRFAQYNKVSTQFTHVYIVVKLNGRDVIMDAVYEYFDSEHPYSSKKDFAAAAQTVSGVRGINKPQNNGLIVVGLVLLGLILNNKI
ncbi:MAG: transglutaminase domain-containing protein [Planktothrix sp.]